MPRWKDMTLSGWGRNPGAASRIARPERIRELQALVPDPDGQSSLARGAGRSYGDAALNSAGHTLLTTRLDRMLEFDEASGQLVTEPGVRFIDVISTFLPRGFMVPVAPGTGFATLAGGIANDVHGKNQHVSGSLGHHLEWFDLRLPDGTRRRVSADDADPLFRATLGGMGLTGIIDRLCLRLKPVPSDSVTVTKRRVRDLDDFLEAFETHRSSAEYIVGWIDALAKGAALGRGVLEVASPCENAVAVKRPAPRRIPFALPNGTLNPLTIRAFNALYHARAPAEATETSMRYEQFLFPLDRLLDWNRIYGSRGFHQFQCLVPFAGGREALRAMLELIARDGGGSFLAVLKAMETSGRGFLSFPGPGYTLALDFPARKGVRALIGKLEAIAADAGGRVYLAKDSTLDPQTFARMYPELPAFRAALRSIDPEQRMQSDLATRLRIRDES